MIGYFLNPTERPNNKVVNARDVKYYMGMNGLMSLPTGREGANIISWHSETLFLYIGPCRLPETLYNSFPALIYLPASNGFLIFFLQ